MRTVDIAKIAEQRKEAILFAAGKGVGGKIMKGLGAAFTGLEVADAAGRGAKMNRKSGVMPIKRPKVTF